MLDENLPTYRFRPSSENPLHTILYFTHNGSHSSAEFLLKRPAPASSHNQYALGLVDIHHSSILFAETLLTPDWAQPTLSAAEVRAQGGSPVAVAGIPHAFSILLYNPDQSIQVNYKSGSWSKDAWEFEVPERSFKLPSTSRLDQDGEGAALGDIIPKVNFRWKRDGRVSRDMTCYMSGKTVGGQKNKEPDITVALFKGGKNDGAVAIYEPNLRRVDVEDRKGLEMILLMSAEIIRDLYLSPKNDPFNTSGAPPPQVNGKGKQPVRPAQAAAPGPAMSGALTSSQDPKPPSPHTMDARRKAEIDAETKRLQALVASEQRQVRDRERRDQEEQDKIKRMLEQEDSERKRKEDADIERETERLRKEYGVSTEASSSQRPTSPDLPPRPTRSSPPRNWLSPTPASRPNITRPQSVGPHAQSQVHFYPQQQPQQQQQPPQQQNGGNRKKLGQYLSTSPYAGPGAATVSSFFGGRGGTSAQQAEEEEEKKRKKMRKRSVHF